MKTKFKGVLGVALTLVLLLSLTVGMAVPAAAGTLEWSKMSFPKDSSDGDYFRDADITAVGPVAKAIDGSLFAYAAGVGLVKSDDGGRSWSKTKYPGGEVIAIEPSSIDEDIVYVATEGAVYKSTDVSSSSAWGKVAEDSLDDILITGENTEGAITSLDVGYKDGDAFVFIGTKGADGDNHGDVYFYKTGYGATWKAMLVDIDTVDEVWDVYSVACDPNFDDTSKVMAVVTTNEGTAPIVLPEKEDPGTANWSTTYAKSGAYSVELYSDGTAAYGKVVMPLEMAFADLDDFSVMVEGGAAAQALPLLDIEMNIAGTATSVDLSADNGNNPGGADVDLAGKIVQIASQPGQSDDPKLSPTLMSDGIAGWEKYGTHTDADIDVGTGDYWSMFVYSDARMWEATYDYYTWDEIHTALDDYATVYEVKVELRYPQDPDPVASTVYVDDITINGVTYGL